MLQRFLLLMAVPVFSPAQELPEGKGKELVEKICSACHGTDLVAAHKDSRAGWEGLVADMYGRGAASSDAERERLLQYLSAYLKK